MCVHLFELKSNVEIRREISEHKNNTVCTKTAFLKTEYMCVPKKYCNSPNDNKNYQ